MEQIEVQLQHASLSSVRPAQMTVGMREVTAKRKELRKLSKEEKRERMSQTVIPGVKGPADAYYLIDHHHEALALLREGGNGVSIAVVKDLSGLSQEAFWTFLDHFSWVHCYDDAGRRRPWSEMPKTLMAMRDDPYRSLASAVRDAGGFAKSREPFLEFLWANFLREKISSTKLKEDWKDAVARALELTASRKAKHLPGWCGEE